MGNKTLQIIAIQFWNSPLIEIKELEKLQLKNI